MAIEQIKYNDHWGHPQIRFRDSQTKHFVKSPIPKAPKQPKIQGIREEHYKTKSGKEAVRYRNEKGLFVKALEALKILKGTKEQKERVTYAEPPMTHSPKFDKAMRQAEIEGYIHWDPQMTLEELSDQFASYANRRETHYYPTEKQLSAIQWELWMSKH